MNVVIAALSLLSCAVIIWNALTKINRMCRCTRHGPRIGHTFMCVGAAAFAIWVLWPSSDVIDWIVLMPVGAAIIRLCDRRVVIGEARDVW